ncbi:MAG: FprA family A-type flavoprotein [Treponema sp.]|nr:FprA family A-type flavoprotein [Treponema sp.]
MKVRSLNNYIDCIHADFGSNELFEGIWPIPGGVSLNSYIIKGEKTALIDLFRDNPQTIKSMEEGIASAGLRFADVDYLILNHLEPDHTGWLREFRNRNPHAKIISTAKGIELIKSFHKIDSGLQAVKNGDTLDLGEGKTPGSKILKFIETPNIHWPETMVTWEAASGTLFPCDGFGSYGAIGDRIFDDERNQTELEFFKSESLRYFANIVSTFSSFVNMAAEKLTDLEIRCVAPSHGLIWRKNPQSIIDLYLRYAGYNDGIAEPEISIIWGSMYGNTKAGLDAVIKGINDEKVPYTIHRIPDENISVVLADAFKSRGIVLAMPTYEYGMFPPMAHVMDIFRRKHIFSKKALRIGSFGWSGGAEREYDAASANLKWTGPDPVEWAGFPGRDDLELLQKRGKELAGMVKSE